MRLVQQPPESSLCGQCCIAMVAGVSLSRAIAVVGHERGTHTCDLIRTLHALGVDCASKAARVRRADKGFVFPETAIVHVRWQKGTTASGNKRWRGHWVVYHRGAYMDPAADGDARWPNDYPPAAGARAVSYLKVGA